MTDNEIIKALECCTTNGASCKDCPAFAKVDRSNCKKYFRGALDLINRQKAEIERLEKGSLKEAMIFNSKTIENVKAEAIKEFAERLKEDVSNHRLEMYMNGLNGTPRTREITYECVEEYIDNLVKEMVCDVG